MDSLGDKDHAVLMGRYWFGESLAEVGKRVGLNEGAVRVRLTRLRKRLRDFLLKKGITL